MFNNFDFLFYFTKFNEFEILMLPQISVVGSTIQLNSLLLYHQIQIY